MQRLFRVIVVHEGLLNLEVWRQLVLMELHVRGHQLHGGEEKVAHGAAVHEGAGVRLQVADHSGAASEEAQTHLALVGFLSGVDSEVVGELPRVGEPFAAEAAPVPLPTRPTAFLPGVPIGENPRGTLKELLGELFRHVKAHSCTQTQADSFTETPHVLCGGAG